MISHLIFLKNLLASLATFVPSIAPIITATMHMVTNKTIGMTNLFFRYQGFLVNMMKSHIKSTDEVRLT
jgi:hypothetical protein